MTKKFNILRNYINMPLARRRRIGIRRRRVYRRRRGAGLLDMLKSAHSFIKNNRVISTVGKALGSVGVPYASAIGNAASSLGYGRRRYVRRRVGRPRIVGRPVGSGVRRRRVVRRRRGGSLRSILSSAHGFVKKNQLVSKALSH
ncbi:MAG TPA: hypothetical protein PLS50_06000 [Candidatus Dojkabacteria bacterium]|nr:hypothetical protein [Candidatus Dojkabacteria bacterium]